jgi:hypothetical protein
MNDRSDLHEQGDLGPVIDAQARAAYQGRLTELADDLADAEHNNDEGRIAVVTAERDALIAQLTQAYGLGGRPRRAGSPVERARTTVTARIRDGIRRIEAVHPELGRHLRHSIRTGTLCSYEPESPVDWTFGPADLTS